MRNASGSVAASFITTTTYLRKSMVPQMLSRHRMNTPSAQPNLMTLPSGTWTMCEAHHVNKMANEWFVTYSKYNVKQGYRGNYEVSFGSLISAHEHLTK